MEIVKRALKKVLEYLMCLGCDLSHIISLFPTLVLASHCKLNKVQMILDFVLVYIGGERDEKQTYETNNQLLRSYVLFIFA